LKVIAENIPRYEQYDSREPDTPLRVYALLIWDGDRDAFAIDKDEKLIQRVDKNFARRALAKSRIVRWWPGFFWSGPRPDGWTELDLAQAFFLDANPGVPVPVLEGFRESST
jgi:hypothetical protein